MSIAANLERIRNEIADACARAHRSPADVALMAVSKTHPADAILEAIAAGQRLFGENRVQEFAAKRDELAASVAGNANSAASFHLIGPLQSNKTALASALFDAVDTVDSERIARRLNDAAATLGKILPILIEIKLSHEDSKHGIAPEALPALLEAIALLPHVEPSGLMTVPAFTDDPERARPTFRELRRLRDLNGVQHPALRELSMGMSHDFRIAVEEGSTCVRIGTAIFGAREHA